MHPTILNLPLLLLLVHRAHSQIDPQCSILTDYINGCEVLTPSFTLLALPAQATCFCYDPQGNFSPDSFDQAALGCYQWALSSDTTLAADISTGGLVGLCTDATFAAAATSSGAAVTRAGGGGSIPTDSGVSSVVAVTGASSTLSRLIATETSASRNGGGGGGGGGGVTKAPVTSATPAPTTAGNNPKSSPSQVAIKTSSEGALWTVPIYLSAVAILIPVLALALA